MITAAFFPEHTALILVSVYLIGILVAILSALLLKSTMFKGDSVPFVMELPSYRIPSAKSVVLHMWEKAKDFLRKAFTIIFVASIVIWFYRAMIFLHCSCGFRRFHACQHRHLDFSYVCTAGI